MWVGMNELARDQAGLTFLHFSLVCAREEITLAGAGTLAGDPVGERGAGHIIGLLSSVY